ncbi:MAG: adenosylcobalamin-dependent ribonucleoside-diphosphate reductase [Nitrosopumilales archaeon]|nr:adenosylcobalamin-dependent ribonucleoside-diphosphate reductase [Nitrosopumilales archaeon]
MKKFQNNSRGEYDSKIGPNAMEVLKRRYLLRSNDGKIIETPSQMFRRVAKAVASAELMYRTKNKPRKIEEEFFTALSNLEFLPNTPTLMNAGTKVGQLSACFVIPVEDSLSGIFEAAKWTAIIHQSGGGTGFSFSKLRPSGDVVKSVDGQASGPITFMTIFDKTTEVIKQGGKRRGANMGILQIDHPDIIKFINCKSSPGFLSNFNISVAVTDKFLNAVKQKKKYSLVNPRTNKVVKKIDCASIFNQITANAWKTGDPGLIFIDEINRHNPTPHLGKIEATNPCGEQPLLPWESCNLGSINLSKVITDGKINWKKLKKLVHLGVRFLDDVISVNKYPAPQIEKITKSNRKIGLGVMGFAEALIKLGIPYNSKNGLEVATKIMGFIKKEGHHASQILGKERGNFPNFEKSLWKNKRNYKYMRNATVTTIAPTGTISIIAGCSSGIEPLFAISFVRNIMNGTKLIETIHLFENIAKKRKFYSKILLENIAKAGSIQKNTKVPYDIKKIFVTALDISPEWHVRMQSVFQKYTDNAVSKTINLPQTADYSEVKKAFLLAHKLKCKGITVYRYGSKPDQVLTIESFEKKRKRVVADSEFSGGCEGIVCPH